MNQAEEETTGEQEYLKAAQQDVPDQADTEQAPADAGHADSAVAAVSTGQAAEQDAAAELVDAAGDKLDSLSGGRAHEPAGVEAADVAAAQDADNSSSTGLQNVQHEQQQQQEQEAAADATCSAEVGGASVTAAGAEPAHELPAADASTSETSVQPAAVDQDNPAAGVLSEAGQQESASSDVQPAAGMQDSTAASVQSAVEEQDSTAADVHSDAGQQQGAAAEDPASRTAGQADAAHAEVPVAAAGDAFNAHGDADTSRGRQPSKAYFVDGVRVSTLVHANYCAALCWPQSCMPCMQHDDCLVHAAQYQHMCSSSAGGLQDVLHAPHVFAMFTSLLTNTCAGPSTSTCAAAALFCRHAVTILLECSCSACMHMASTPYFGSVFYIIIIIIIITIIIIIIIIIISTP
jgi:hypothetical protein